MNMQGEVVYNIWQLSGQSLAYAGWWVLVSRYGDWQYRPTLREIISLLPEEYR